MTSEDYINERLNNQINWYDKESIKNKRWFYTLSILEILLALSIPFLSNLTIEESLWLSRIIGLLGLVIAAIASILLLSKFQANWIEYRLTSESLKSEKFMYLTKSGPYGQDQSCQNLVQRIEGIMSKENSNWFKLQGDGQKKNIIS